MVFAHGYGCDQAMWRYVAPHFEAEHRVVLFDHVGFGGSDLGAWSAERYQTLDAYAEDLVEIIEELDLREVIFVGHSVAAMIGVLASIKVPERFARLVLVGPSARYVDDPDAGYVGGFSSSDIQELLETLDANHLGWSAGMAPVIMGNPERPELAAELEASFCRSDPAVSLAFARATFLSDNRADLERVSTPALILQCRADAIAGEEVGWYVHEHLRDSDFVTLDASGHCPNLSAPDETAGAIRTYLDVHAARR
ncbi:MAG: Sigma factor sigB regulation protein rsbQ [Jatrophihabitans sp.]|nr:Sigma factor sigB regulation protein rsbQ [Jatrophihabitans sp.]